MNFQSLPALVMHCLAALALDCCALGLAGAPEFFAQVFRLEDFTEILRLGLPTELAANGRLLCQGMWPRLEKTFFPSTVLAAVM